MSREIEVPKIPSITNALFDPNSPTELTPQIISSTAPNSQSNESSTLSAERIANVRSLRTSNSFRRPIRECASEVTPSRGSLTITPNVLGARRSLSDINFNAQDDSQEPTSPILSPRSLSPISPLSPRPLLNNPSNPSLLVPNQTTRRRRAISVGSRSSPVMEGEGNLSFLQPHLPNTLLKYFEMEKPPTPFVENWEAVILFADISGFTKLTDYMARQGEDGPEKFARCLNEYFSLMISIINSYGGDVLKFIGDALMVLFKSSPARASGISERCEKEVSELTEACLSATACSFKLIKTLDNYIVKSAGDISLTLHISVGIGKLNSMNVGVGDTWQFLVCGEALASAAELLDNAKSGEVVISEKARELLKHCEKNKMIEIETVDLKINPNGHKLKHLVEKFPPIEMYPVQWTDVVANSAKRYILPLIVQASQVDRGKYLAQLRRVSVIFINLKNITWESSLEDVQRGMETVVKVLEKYGGTLRKYLMDDKGTILVCVFGLPHLSFENDSERAVRAALDLRLKLKVNCGNFKIGITTGEAFCGTVGSENRCEYDILGSVVNMAARLMSSAEDQSILCDEETFKSSNNRVMFDQIPPIKVKGREEKINVYKARHLINKLSHDEKKSTKRTILFGREKERSLFLDCLKNEQNIIIIQGEQGIGKTSFLESLISSVAQKGILPFSTTCHDLDSSAPFSALGEIVAALLIYILDRKDQDITKKKESNLQKLGDRRMSTPSLLENRKTELRRLSSLPRGQSFHIAPKDSKIQVSSFSSSHNHRLSEMLDLFTEKFPEYKGQQNILASAFGIRLPDSQNLPSEAKNAYLRTFLKEIILRELSFQPIMIIIDNAQHMDSLSWKLAEELSFTPKLHIVLSMRPPKLVISQLESLKSKKNTVNLELLPLKKEDVMEIGFDILNVSTIPETIVENILKDSGGNPFYIEELMRTIKMSDGVKIENGELVVASSSESSLTLPKSASALIVTRFDKFEHRKQLLLKIASVIGMEFTLENVCILSPVYDDVDVLIKTLREFVEDNILMLTESNKYRFRHKLFQETIYGMLLVSQRKEIHLSIGNLLEQMHGEDLSSIAVVLANHFHRADEFEKAMKFYDMAAISAFNQCRYSDCVSLYRKFDELMEQNQSSKVFNNESMIKLAWSHLTFGLAAFRSGLINEAEEKLLYFLLLLGFPSIKSKHRTYIDKIIQKKKESNHKHNITCKYKYSIR